MVWSTENSHDFGFFETSDAHVQLVKFPIKHIVLFGLIMLHATFPAFPQKINVWILGFQCYDIFLHQYAQLVLNFKVDPIRD